MQPVKHFRRFVMPSSAGATLLPETLLGCRELPSQIRHALAPLYQLWCGSLAAFVFWGVLKVKINQTAINCGAFGNMGNSIRSSNVKGFKRCVCYLSINVSICRESLHHPHPHPHMVYFIRPRTDDARRRILLACSNLAHLSNRNAELV